MCKGEGMGGGGGALHVTADALDRALEVHVSNPACPKKLRSIGGRSRKDFASRSPRDLCGAGHFKTGQFRVAGCWI